MTHCDEDYIEQGEDTLKWACYRCLKYGVGEPSELKVVEDVPAPHPLLGIQKSRTHYLCLRCAKQIEPIRW